MMRLCDEGEAGVLGGEELSGQAGRSRSSPACAVGTGGGGSGWKVLQLSGKLSLNTP